LEESLTLEELTETYGKILKNRSEALEFKAKLAGANIKSSSPAETSETGEKQEPKPRGIVDSLRQKKQAEMQQSAKSGERTTFSDGVGYMVI
jgi:hypothetical protein